MTQYVAVAQLTPAIIAAAGEHASCRFIEYLTTQISNSKKHFANCKAIS